MRILGLDTATTATAAALVDTDTAVEHECRDDPPSGTRPRHAQRLLSLAAEVLDRAGTDWRDVGLIAVGLGPGSFTGLRIGVATARGLAQALGAPLAGVGTLESLALAAATATLDAAPARVVIPVLDARRHEVFAAGWRIPLADGRAPDGDTDAWETILEPVALPPGSLAHRLAQVPAPAPLAVGDGALQSRDVLERAGALVPEDSSPLHRVSAVVHCRLAAARGRCSPARAAEIAPRYLRAPDAELALRPA